MLRQFGATLILTTVVLVGCTGDSDHTIADSRTRIVLPFNMGWKFAKDLPESNEYPAPDFDDMSWEDVTIPHTPHIELLVVNNQWQGDAWYRKSFSMPADLEGKKVFLRFEGAMQVAQVWLNGESIGTHAGGYLPFAFDVTSSLRFDRPNVVAVGLNNDDDPSVPPGKPLSDLDFNTYGGIYRNVALIAVEPLHISDPLLADVQGGGGVYAFSTDVTGESARLHVRVHVQNDDVEAKETRVRMTLRNDDGDTEILERSPAQLVGAGSDHTFSATYLITHPKLWSPRQPNLYQLTTEVLVGSQPSDSVQTRIGIREYSLSASGGFQVNGEPMFIRGTNRHQEYPFVGYALSDEAQYRDAVKIKNAGFDMVRLSHYPHAEAFMRAADELGLILMDAIPGWQFFGDEVFQDRAISDVRQMARRDRNHPSVAFWEVSLNESGMDDAFMERANEALRAEFPGQTVITAGWIDHPSYDLFIPARQHSRPPDYWSKYRRDDRAIFIAEYGDWEYFAQNAGFRQTEFRDLKEEERSSRQLRAFGEERLLQQALNYQEAANSNRRGGSTVGHANWLMFDYNRGYADDIEASGIRDIFRLPKFAYHFYRSQRPPGEAVTPPSTSGPMVFIANYWTPGSVNDVRVFSNTDEVELSINGRSLGRQTPDSNVNTTHLAYPPFTFSVAAFEPGTLTAVGYIDREPVATYEVTTPAERARLSLEVDYSGVPVSREHDDLVFVYASVLDRNGNPVPDDTSQVRFEIEGDGAIVGPNTVKAEAGIATILVRTIPSSKMLIVHAESGGLDVGTIEIKR